LPLAPFVAFALGAALALVASPGADASGRRALALVSLFAALVVAPACAAPLFVAEDWALGYLVDPAAVPSAVELVIVVACAASVVAGFVLAREPARTPAARAALVGSPCAVAIAVAAALGARLGTDGTYHEVHGRFATEPVLGGRLGWVVLVIVAAIASGAAYTASRLRAGAPSDGRRARTRARGHGLGVRA
jgi:hypothetical protein